MLRQHADQGPRTWLPARAYPRTLRNRHRLSDVRVSRCITNHDAYRCSRFAWGPRGASESVARVAGMASDKEARRRGSGVQAGCWVVVGGSMDGGEGWWHSPGGPWIRQHAATCRCAARGVDGAATLRREVSRFVWAWPGGLTRSAGVACWSPAAVPPKGARRARSAG